MANRILTSKQIYIRYQYLSILEIDFFTLIICFLIFNYDILIIQEKYFKILNWTCQFVISVEITDQ